MADYASYVKCQERVSAVYKVEHTCIPCGPYVQYVSSNKSVIACLRPDQSIDKWLQAFSISIVVNCVVLCVWMDK